MTEDRAGQPARDETDRVELVVPLQRASTASARRTWSPILAWALGLSGIIAAGLFSQLPPAPGPAHPAEPATTAVAEVEITPTPGSSGRVRSVPRAAAPPHRSLGDDGLIGGLPFGDAVPRLTQADIERDGFRYYGELLARSDSSGRRGPP